jgi:F420-0:gamma-glutamyl ligase
MQPPQDDLFSVIDEYLTDVKERDVIVVTSKVVAIYQGRCVLKVGADKQQLITQEADYIIDATYREYPLTLKYHAMFASAGIDESNSGDYYSLLPSEPFIIAKEICDYIKKKYNLSKIGVIITDSHLMPFRFGVLGISIGFWGIRPVEYHKGKMDLFGREIKFSSTNLIDGIAAAAGLVAGESHECHPIVIARDVPYLQFSDEDHSKEFLIDPKEDIHRVLFERFIT